MIFESIQVILLVGIVASAFFALKNTDLVASAIFLAATSLLLSTEFYLLQAPDVAIAEAAIGAGLSTAIFIVAITKTERWENGKK